MYRTPEELARDELERQKKASPESEIRLEDVVVPLSQGDILDGCPIVFWSDSSEEVEGAEGVVYVYVRVVILTQACDLAQKKTRRAVVAVVHDARSLVETGRLKASFVRANVRPGKVYGWYFLPADPQRQVEESLVSFQDLHTIPIAMLNRLRDQGKHLCRVMTPYREHMAQHFSVTFSRIGLPEPYETEP